MEDSGVDFHGFQTCIHKDELEYRKPLSRLQRRAPCPLQIKPTAFVEKHSEPQANAESSSSSSSSLPSRPTMAAPSFNSFYHGKDPIPLLSPLVSPSLLQPANVRERNPAKWR